MNTQTQNDYLLLFRGTEWINQLSGTDVQKVVSDWAAWFDLLIQEGK